MNDKLAVMYIVLDPSVEEDAIRGISISDILQQNSDFDTTVKNAIANSHNPVHITVNIKDIDSSKVKTTLTYSYQVVMADGAASEGSKPICFRIINRRSRRYVI